MQVGGGRSTSLPSISTAVFRKRSKERGGVHRVHRDHRVHRVYSVSYVSDNNRAKNVILQDDYSSMHACIYISLNYYAKYELYRRQCSSMSVDSHLLGIHDRFHEKGNIFPPFVLPLPLLLLPRALENGLVPCVQFLYRVARYVPFKCTISTETRGVYTPFKLERYVTRSLAHVNNRLRF